MTRRLRILSGILATVAAAPLPAQTDTAVKPFRMIGNI